MTFLGMLSKDVADVVRAACSKDFAQSLSPLHTLRRESIRVIAVGVLGRFLAVANQVNYWRLYSCQTLIHMIPRE